jgi:acetate kinase
MSSDPVVLCLNSGSSSLKFALFRLASGRETRLAAGSVEGIGLAQGRLHLHLQDREPTMRAGAPIASPAEALARALDTLASERLPLPQAVGHRLVHGGDAYTAPVCVDDATLASLWKVASFAPLHMPAELRAIEATRTRFPDLPQVACFDTAFHRGLPEKARRLPLPSAYHEQGIRRYGFHGLSYEYIVETLGSELGRRSILAHLGSGSSMVALVDQKPIDTTMSFTPTGGLMMGTRPGDLDPGVLLHLLQTGHGLADLERIIHHDSGLLGVSGSTSDMKTLLERRLQDERAALAIEMFCYRVKMAVGALAASLGGLDTLVFTGGIGQHAAPIRAEICQGLEFLGIELEASYNDAARDVISRVESPCTVRVVATDEERTILRQVGRLLFRLSSRDVKGQG